MAKNTSRGGGSRSATPILSSDAAQRVKERTQRAWERDVNNMVRERSAYRLFWPVALILLTALNVILAGDYMVRIADAEGPPVMWGLTRAEVINWFIAFALIVSGRILIVLLGDDATEGAGAFLGRVGVRLVIGGLIAFSIWTAAAETATKLQSKVDKGAAASAQVVAAGEVVSVTGAALTGAGDDLAAARADLTNAQRRAEDARREWATYQADMKARYTGGDLAWVLNATHSSGPARPYLAAITAADSAVEAARARLGAAGQAVADARASMIAAQRDAARAAETTGSEGTVIESFGAMIPAFLGGPWSAPIVIAVWGWVAAILLEVVCFAGAGATGRILRDALNRHDDTRGGKADEIRREAQARVQSAPVRPAQGFAPAPQPSTVVPITALQPADAGPEAGTDPATMARYAEQIADALADAEGGILTDATVPNIKARYRVSQSGAYAIRDALVNEGLFMPGPGGTLVRAA